MSTKGQKLRISAGDALDAAISITQSVVQLVPEPFKSTCSGVLQLVVSVRTTAQQVQANKADIEGFALHVLDLINIICEAANKRMLSDAMLNDMSEFFEALVKFERIAREHASLGFWTAHLKSKSVTADINDLRQHLDMIFKKFNFKRAISTAEYHHVSMEFHSRIEQAHKYEEQLLNLILTRLDSYLTQQTEQSNHTQKQQDLTAAEFDGYTTKLQIPPVVEFPVGSDSSHLPRKKSMTRSDWISETFKITRDRLANVIALHLDFGILQQPLFRKLLAPARLARLGDFQVDAGKRAVLFLNQVAAKYANPQLQDLTAKYFVMNKSLRGYVRPEAVSAANTLSPDWDTSDWITRSFIAPFDFVASSVEPYLDRELASEESFTELLPPTLRAIILDSSTQSQTRSRWLLVYIENSASEELQAKFLGWMTGVEDIEYLVKV